MSLVVPASSLSLAKISRGGLLVRLLRLQMRAHLVVLSATKWLPRARRLALSDFIFISHNQFNLFSF